MDKSITIIGFTMLLLTGACTPEQCLTDQSDIPIKVNCYTDTPIVGSPLKNMPFLLTVINCSSSTPNIIKNDTLLTDANGRIDTIIKNLKSFICEGPNCKPKVNITAIPPKKFINWGNVNTANFTSVPFSFGVFYRDKNILKVNIKHDSTDVSEMFVSIIQGFGNPSKLSATQTIVVSKLSFNKILFFDIVKSEDLTINILFDKKIVKTEIIPASKLDTVSRSFIL
jgi:hypothetical protein